MASRMAAQKRKGNIIILDGIPKAIWLDKSLTKELHLSHRSKRINIMFRSAFYRMIDTLPTEIANEIKQSQTFDGNITISIHGCRHLFADYLLRRFEGDVFRAIRRHFAHSSKNVMNFTLAYIRNKIAPIERRRCEIAYTKELIKRMVGDVNHTMFTGNSVEYVRKYLNKFSWKTPEELDFLLDEWLNDEDEGLERIVPHSYGFCLLFKNRIKQAKCLDKQGVAKVDRGDSQTCVGSGCANLGVDADSHLATLEQIKVTHENILASINNKGGLMSLLKSNNNIRFKRSSRTIQVINTLEAQLGISQG
ncbi:hypothetical protein ASV53_15390 [Photobacterium sanguinicancri]|uniref:Integrase n=1 Tax=Photobacterium sanguinicancri TaxID=875932 RepID=A0ABX4FXF5_9GAMM|nr:hypothetical protein ASV53_15390 [Photobacterium sanguinicancri]